MRTFSTRGSCAYRLSVCLSACLPACLPACLSACLPVCLSVCLPACLPACLPPACLPACLPVCLSACLPACLPVCPSVCLPICLSACLSVCPCQTDLHLGPMGVHGFEVVVSVFILWYTELFVWFWQRLLNTGRGPITNTRLWRNVFKHDITLRC